ncbi:hypothetical protein [Pseudomonas sp. Marseille-P9899]|uniref:hypothetical protein n=1 Tax=Pseudomonas sp. Marseille-P9899 TaxID=2730401 RepID=UPI00158D981B|nr:hypothetical protein [Pseudomonas sp. Marseille-P9899]
MRKLFAVALVSLTTCGLLALSGCSSSPDIHVLDIGQTNYEAVSNLKAADASATVGYVVDGHFYTAGYVAYLAGYDSRTSLELACSTQAPDEIFKLNAVPVSFWIIGPTYRHQVVNGLHSLHGGDTAAVMTRRAVLKQMISESAASTTTPKWQTGFLIHAFGDSYAHVHHNPPEAYGEGVGHLFDSLSRNDPDAIFINDNHVRYVEYVRELFEALSQARQPGKAASPALDTFIGNIKAEAEKGEDKEKKVTIVMNDGRLGHDPETARKACKDMIIDDAQIRPFLQNLSKRLDEAQRAGS